MHGTVAMPSTAEIRSVLWPVKNMPSKSEVRTALLVCCLRQMKYTVYLRSVPSKTKMCTVHWSMHSSKISWNIQCTYNQCLPQLKYAMYFCQYLPHLKSMQCSLVNAVHSWNMQCVLVTAFHNWSMQCTFVSAFHIWKVCSVLWSMPSTVEICNVFWSLPSTTEICAVHWSVPSMIEMCRVLLSMPSISEKYAVYFGQCLLQLKSIQCTSTAFCLTQLQYTYRTMHIYCSVQPSRAEYSYCFASAGGPSHGRKTTNQNCKLQALADYSIIGCRKATTGVWPELTSVIISSIVDCDACDSITRTSWTCTASLLYTRTGNSWDRRWSETLQRRAVARYGTLGWTFCECCQFWEWCQEPAKNTAVCLPAKQQSLFGERFIMWTWRFCRHWSVLTLVVLAFAEVGFGTGFSVF